MTSKEDLEEELERVKKERDLYKKKYTGLMKKSLSKRELEAYEMVAAAGKKGFGVWELADSRDISYAAAYQLLEKVKKAGLIDDEWEKKGHKKRYFST